MTLHTPQIIYLCLLMLGMGVALSRHGQPKTGAHNAMYDIVATAIVVSLLYWGGFFG